MDIQLLVVAVIFLLALLYTGRNLVLKLRGKKKAGCEDCGIAESKK